MGLKRFVFTDNTECLNKFLEKIVEKYWKVVRKVRWMEELQNFFILHYRKNANK